FGGGPRARGGTPAPRPGGKNKPPPPPPPPPSPTPPAGEPGPPQPRDEVGAAAHDVPDQAGAVVLHGQDDGALVDAEVVRRDPPAGRAVLDGEGLVERRLEPVGPGHPQVQRREVANRRDDDLRGERQRGDHDPRGDGAVVRAERGAPGVIVEELALDPAHDALHPAGAVAGREPPAMLAVAG